MALTIKNLTIASTGNVYQSRFQLAFDNNYLTGGMELLAKYILLNRINQFSVVSNEQGYLFDFDYVNSKVMVLEAAGGEGFVGNALPSHTHVLQPTTHSTSGSNPRVYVNTASITGTFQTGEIITGGTSGNTATLVNGTGVVVHSTTGFVLTGPTGNFMRGETITGGTSGATAVLYDELYVNWQLAPDFQQNSIVTAMTNNTHSAMIQLPVDSLLSLAPGNFRFLNIIASFGVETLRADGFTSVVVDGLKNAVSLVSAGTPSGSISGSGGGEVPGGTDLTSLNSVECLVLGI